MGQYRHLRGIKRRGIFQDANKIDRSETGFIVVETGRDRDAASLLTRLAQTRVERVGTQIRSARVTCAVIKRPIGIRKHRI